MKTQGGVEEKDRFSPVVLGQKFVLVFRACLIISYLFILIDAAFGRKEGRKKTPTAPTRRSGSPLFHSKFELFWAKLC
jgi:hypothetical protein